MNPITGDWSTDGKHLIYALTGARAFQLWKLDLAQRRASPLLTSEFSQMHPALSPDGRWIAYASEETGKYEVYVQRFPEGGAKRQISVSGGAEPRWRRDGRELFYLTADWLMAAAIHATPASLAPDRPVELFAVRPASRPQIYRRNYDVTADGQRFLVNSVADAQAPPSITVVTDWRSRLR